MILITLFTGCHQQNKLYSFETKKINNQVILILKNTSNKPIDLSLKDQKIIQIKDTFHSNAAGNIAQAAHFFTKNKSALITFYICENCGYIEEYLDQDEIVKLK